MIQYLLMIIGVISGFSHVFLILLFFINIRMFYITNKKNIISICKNLPKRSNIISDSDNMN